MLSQPIGTEPDSESQQPRMRGTVKWFDPRRGFGFILMVEGPDVFVHYSAIQQDGFRSLPDGREVEYVLSAGEKGWFAENVKLLNEPSSSNCNH